MKAKSHQELMAEFDRLRFSETETKLTIDSGRIINRVQGDRDEIMIQVDTGIAAGFKAFAMSPDFPGEAHERVLFFAQAVKNRKVRFRLHAVTGAGIRVRPLPFDAVAD